MNVKTNLPDFKRQMDAMGKDFVKVAAAASRAAANEIAKEVRKLAPRDSGRLRKAVVIKRARRVPRGSVQYIVGIRQGKSQQRIQRKRKGQKVSVNLDAFYWRFLEGGWVPGKRSGLRGGRRVRALQAKRARAVRSTVRHPFIAPAFQRASGKALSTFFSTLDAGTKRLK